MKTDQRLLWVEVTKTSVLLKYGPTMPAPSNGMYSSMLFGGGNSVGRKEFARWSGVRFPEEGIYGLRCPLAVIERYRSVEEKSYVAAEKTTRRLVRV